MTAAIPLAQLSVALNEDVERLLSQDAVVAIGVSSGKDSQAAAIATIDHLDAIGHRGPRVLIHADLGMVEWEESLPNCQELADRLGLELIVVRRKGGGLMERWESRWESSVRRYANLETVTLVPCWSTPAMRFCTSELKVAPITSELRRRFPGQDIVNVTGVRRAESRGRAAKPVSDFAPRAAKKHGQMLNWRSIIEHSTEAVIEFIPARGHELHVAYTQHGLTRVSCRFCIMSSIQDLQRAAAVASAHPLLRRMVALEARSSFAFQGDRWLADVNPEALGEELQAQIMRAKQVAAARKAAEARIPNHLLYTSGWPTCIPSRAEAELLAEVRREVSQLLGIESSYLTADSVIARYEELMAQKPAAKVTATAPDVVAARRELRPEDQLALPLLAA